MFGRNRFMGTAAESRSRRAFRSASDAVGVNRNGKPPANESGAPPPYSSRTVLDDEPAARTRRHRLPSRALRHAPTWPPSSSGATAPTLQSVAAASVARRAVDVVPYRRGRLGRAHAGPDLHGVAVRRGDPQVAVAGDLR